MAGYLNKVQLMGNLGKDPEVRHTQDGRKVVSLTVATSEYWKDKITNERRDRTEWHNVVIFNDKIGEIAEKYLRKGSKVFLEGRLQTREWEDDTATKRFKTEIILQNFKGELMLMDSKLDNQGDDQNSQFGASPTIRSNKPEKPFAHVRGNSADPVVEDEIPF